MARKRKSKPTKGGVQTGRGERQRIKDRLDHAQDDARHAGIISNDPLPPEVSPKPERVDPSSQTERRLPLLIGRAIRRGWSVPDELKPGLVDELIVSVCDPEVSPAIKALTYGALLKGDQLQWERDQAFVRLERVIELWKGVLDAIRSNVSDPVVLKAVIADVLRLLPVASDKKEEVGGGIGDLLGSE